MVFQELLPPELLLLPLRYRPSKLLYDCILGLSATQSSSCGSRWLTATAQRRSTKAIRIANLNKYRLLRKTTLAMRARQSLAGKCVRLMDLYPQSFEFFVLTCTEWAKSNQSNLYEDKSLNLPCLIITHSHQKQVICLKASNRRRHAACILSSLSCGIAFKMESSWLISASGRVMTACCQASFSSPTLSGSGNS